MKAIYGIFIVAFVFGLGILVGSRFPDDRDDGSNITVPVERSHEIKGGAFDRLRLTQSSSLTADGTTVPVVENLADPRVRTALEKKLREVPFSVLKQVFLERQDEQWARQQERYVQPKELTDAELDRRASQLFESFHRNSEGSNFISRGEWKLRGGKTLPYVALVEYYSSRTDAADAAAGLSGAADATNGRELCYVSTVYFRIDDKYAADGQSNCLSWVAIRGDHPFAVHANYNSKRLVPYFDTISVPLPGFGSDGDVVSEWYDASTNQWASLGRMRFDPVSKDEYRSISKEIQVETDGE